MEKYFSFLTFILTCLFVSSLSIASPAKDPKLKAPSKKMHTSIKAARLQDEHHKKNNLISKTNKSKDEHAAKISAISKEKKLKLAHPKKIDVIVKEAKPEQKHHKKHNTVSTIEKKPAQHKTAKPQPEDFNKEINAVAKSVQQVQMTKMNAAAKTKPQTVLPRKPINLIAEKGLQQSLHKKINAILNTFHENVNIGIVVVNLNSGKILYKKNADRYFATASNQKLFTAWAALNYLNPQFTYQTQLYTDISKVLNGVLYDNISLKFSGDPTLTLSQLEYLISKLARAGVKHVNGKIIIDDSAFDDGTISPGSAWDDQDFCFGSPISSLIFNHNCIAATITPATQLNQTADITLPEQPQFMQFVNHVITGSDKPNCNMEVKANNDSTYTINGCIKINDPPRTIKMAIKNPRFNMQAALIYALKKNQIEVSQGFEFSKINTAIKPFANVTSPSLDRLLVTMLKESDNTIANSLFKTIGSFYSQESGSWKNGHFALHDILTKTIAVDIAKSTFIDGAGGSRYNYITPEQILTLLRKIYSSNHAHFFISALPISGTDGTLKDRMTSATMRGKVYAKTGSETAVTALSGYLLTKNNHNLAFSIVINGFIDTPAKYKALEDKICAALVEDG